MARARLATHRRARVPSVVRDRRRDRCARAMRAAVRVRRCGGVRPPSACRRCRYVGDRRRVSHVRPRSSRVGNAASAFVAVAAAHDANPFHPKRARRRSVGPDAGRTMAMLAPLAPLACAPGRRGHWPPGARRWPPGDAAGRRRRAQFMSAMPMPMRVPPIAATPPRRHASAGWAARAAPSSDGAGGGAGRAGGEGRGRPSGRGVRGALKGSNPCPRHRARGRPPWRNPPP
jgi:hypothetical protein